MRERLGTLGEQKIVGNKCFHAVANKKGNIENKMVVSRHKTRRETISWGNSFPGRNTSTSVVCFLRNVKVWNLHTRLRLLDKTSDEAFLILGMFKQLEHCLCYGAYFYLITMLPISPDIVLVSWIEVTCLNSCGRATKRSGSSLSKCFDVYLHLDFVLTIFKC